jgi:hypothetical protein
MADYDYDFAWSSVFPRRVSKMNRLHIVLLLVLCSGLSACYSPETRRTRGGGSSNIHEGSRPFYQTPQLIRAKPPPLDAANQADELSRK